MKPGKLPGNKQRSQDLSWKVHDRARSFVLCSHTDSITSRFFWLVPRALIMTYCVLCILSQG